MNEIIEAQKDSPDPVVLTQSEVKRLFEDCGVEDEKLETFDNQYEAVALSLIHIFKARARRPRGMGSKFFIPGRTAMTCCADDTSFLGYICKSAYAPKLKPGEWVEVTAKVAFENRSEYQGEGIVLYACLLYTSFFHYVTRDKEGI